MRVYCARAGAWFLLFAMLPAVWAVVAPLSGEEPLEAPGVEALAVIGLEEEGPDDLLLDARTFRPPRGVTALDAQALRVLGLAQPRAHVLLQFDDIPDREEREALAAQGVTLLEYVPNRAWLASVPAAAAEDVAALPGVRALSLLRPRDKLEKELREHAPVPWARRPDGTLSLTVLGFGGGSLDALEASVKEAGGQVEARVPAMNAVLAAVPADRVFELAGYDAVKWVEAQNPRPRRLNDGIRSAIGVESLQASPYDLNGEDVQVGEWDGGWVDSAHDDFTGRLTIGDAGCSETNCGTDSHATHVGGTVAGDGTRSAAEGGSALQWRGMATEAEIISYEWWNDASELHSEYNEAVNTYGIDVSQNSWGFTYSGSDAYGRYDSETAAIDDVVRASKGRRISIAWAAGNERPTCDSGSYDCIIIPATAKNVITVGALNSNNDDMTYFSSWGPTNDGRLKPELVAPGCQLDGDGGVTSAETGDAYSVKCGTSMATPAVSGSLALLYQEHRRLFGRDPWPSSLKALLMQTALDLGREGPDFENGFGKMQVKKAVDFLQRDDGENRLLVEGVISSDGETDAYTLPVPVGAAQLRVSLAWDDPAGDPLASKALVNDLDLNLVDPDGSAFLPLVLEPSSPADVAVAGVDARNNYEQAVVGNPQAGNWKVKVAGTTVPEPDQNYSLAADYNILAEDGVEISAYRDAGYAEKTRFFDANQRLYLEAFVGAGGIGVTGKSVALDLVRADGTLEESGLALSEAGSGYYRGSWNASGHPAGVYEARAKVDGSPAKTGQLPFHLYGESGVSAYAMDANGDAVLDFVLENHHLAAAIAPGMPLLARLLQKDTNTFFSFSVLSDANADGRGEPATQGRRGVQLSGAALSSEGEGLSSAALFADVNLSAPGSLLHCPGGDRACPPSEGLFYRNGTTPKPCTAVYQADDGDQETDCSFSTSQDGGKGAFMQCAFDVSGVPSGSLFTTVRERINMDVSLYNSTHAGLFEVDYYDCSQDTWVQGERVRLFGGGETDFNSENYADAFSWWEQCGGTLKFRWYLKTNWVGPIAYDYLDQCALELKYFPPKKEARFDLNVALRSQDADYLLYQLFGFDGNEGDLNGLFAPLAGRLGGEVSDDRYRFADGNGGLVSGLSAHAWQESDANYAALYDDATTEDDVNDVVAAWVRFEAPTEIDFNGVGAWYDANQGAGAVRIGYQALQDAPAGTLSFLLAFTRGDYSVLDQWMGTLAGGGLPEPNFMTAPGAEFISITLSGFPLSLGALDPGTIDAPAPGNDANDYRVTVDPATNVSVDLYQKGTDFTGPSTLDVNSLAWHTANSVAGATDMAAAYASVASGLSAGQDVNLFYWLDVAGGATAGDYNATVSLKAVKAGESP